MKIKLLLTVLLLTSSAQAERFYLCTTYEGNSGLIREESTTCRPKLIKRELKQFLELGYKADFKKYDWGTEKEALQIARDSYKTYNCRWVELQITEVAQ